MGRSGWVADGRDNRSGRDVPGGWLHDTTWSTLGRSGDTRVRVTVVTCIWLVGYVRDTPAIPATGVAKSKAVLVILNVVTMAQSRGVLGSSVGVWFGRGTPDAGVERIPDVFHSRPTGNRVGRESFGFETAPLNAMGISLRVLLGTS